MRIGTKVQGRLSRKGCLHAAVIARGERTGRCLECGTAVATPFTITARNVAAAPSPSTESLTMGQLITMADYRLPPRIEGAADATLDGAA